MTLKVSELTRTFGNKVAVDHLSFTMDAPGVFGLIGTNGAGKTTTIRMILGILKPDSGSALWNGEKINRETVRFGYLPEERGIYLKSKVLEQLIYFGMLKNMTKEAAKESALHWMERFNIMEYKNTPAEKLSKGNQQKVQMIIALINDPELLFLDEPFSGLDPVNTELFHSVITELRAQNKYILMNSHQMATVESYAHDLVILHKGRSILSGNLREIKAGYGHTRLILDSRPETLELAKKWGLTTVRVQADRAEFKISGDEEAHKIYQAFAEAHYLPLEFTLQEPSLNEIFIEKVGEIQ